jgi:ABC-2 type transport system ATP-binding protein
MGKLVGHLSRGFRQRVGLAQAILGDSRLLVLDEPTAAMDPAQIVAIRELIKDLGRSRTILLSTHILPEVERTCDRVLILDQGRILAEDTPAGLTDRFGGRGIFLLRVDPGVETAAEVEAALAEAPGVTSTSRLDDGLGGVLVRLETESGRDRRAELTSLACGRGWSVLEFRPAHASLEDAFVSIVRREEVAA